MLARARGGTYIESMTHLRKNRLSIGGLVALLLLAAGGLPGALAAAAGPQPVFPLCSPDGAKAPGQGGEESAHCGVCAHFTKTGPALLPDLAGLTVPAERSPFTASPPRLAAPVPRWELAPLSGRGPPVPA